MKKHKHLTKRQLKRERAADELYELISQSCPEDAAAVLNSLTDEGMLKMVERAVKDGIGFVLGISDPKKRNEAMTELNERLKSAGIQEFPVDYAL